MNEVGLQLLVDPTLPWCNRPLHEGIVEKLMLVLFEDFGGSTFLSSIFI